MKGSAEIRTLDEKQFRAYVMACAWCLAHAHACSGDPIDIAGYLGGGTAFEEAMARFGAASAEQTMRDWKALSAVIKDGRLPAETGV
jgi:hypothetical protein